MARYHGKSFKFKRPDVAGDMKELLARGLSWVLNIAGSIVNFLMENPKRTRVIAIGAGVGIVIAFIIILIVDFRHVRSLSTFKPNLTTKIYDKNNVLVSELFRQKREIVTFDKIPKQLVNAFIALEDNEFYEHYGINIKGIVRAFFINVFSGRIKQGGSTITQQLAKILLTSGKRNIYRKVKEAFIALMIEMNYSKDEILDMYLNQIFFGHGTYGVEAAAKLYFNKHVWDLELAEMALLATLPSSPNRLSPIRHPKTSMQRHKIALAKMVELGFITVKEAEEAYMDFWPPYLSYISEVAPSLNTSSSRLDKAPSFTEYIRRSLIKKYGEEAVYEKGLSVYTTLDIKKQIAGQQALIPALRKQTVESSDLGFKNEDYIIDTYSDSVEMVSDLFDLDPFRRKGSAENIKINSYIRNSIIEEFEALNFLAGIDSVDEFMDTYKDTFAQDKDLQQVEGCIISINQNNGYIEAMIGGSEFTSINQLNRVMQMRRQPGSAIKPLLYSAAVESGNFTAATAVLDSPIIYLDNEGGDWLPENYEGEFYGLMRLRKALALSINVISIRIADKLGIDQVLKYYTKLLRMDDDSAKKRLTRNFSIALGSIEVTPLELTRAYAIIANGGRDVIPYAIRYIKDNSGKIIENREEEVNRIISEKKKNGTIQIIKPSTAQVMISMLKSVIAGGTGSSAYPGRPAAGKTGSTNNWKDAWFVGFVPQLTTGMWIGYDKLGLSLGINQSGGVIAAPVWGRYMREAMKGETILDFPGYAGLDQKEICSISGLLPSKYCKTTMSEVFVPGTVPDKECGMCENLKDSLRLANRKEAKINIMEGQKSSILKSIKKGNSGSMLENIENDLMKNE